MSRAFLHKKESDNYEGCHFTKARIHTKIITVPAGVSFRLYGFPWNKIGYRNSTIPPESRRPGPASPPDRKEPGPPCIQTDHFVIEAEAEIRSALAALNTRRRLSAVGSLGGKRGSSPGAGVEGNQKRLWSRLSRWGSCRLRGGRCRKVESSNRSKASARWTPGGNAIPPGTGRRSSAQMIDNRPGRVG